MCTIVSDCIDEYSDEIEQEMAVKALYCASWDLEKAKSLLRDPKWLLAEYCGLNDRVKEAIRRIDEQDPDVFVYAP